MNIIDKFTGVIAPHECLGCGYEGFVLCPACADNITPFPSRCYRCHTLTENFKTCKQCRPHTSLYSVFAFGGYAGVVKETVHLLKFGRAPAAATDIGRILACTLDNSALMVSHIPTAPTRVRQRGYDQAQLIARELAAIKLLDYSSLLLRITVGRQVGQNRQARKTQMSKAFSVANIEQLKNNHVLLVDDVFTTGSTCEAAAKVLIEAGAKRVSAAVFAVA